MNDLVQMVVNQMMKGPNFGRLQATKKQQAIFLRRHEDKIRWVLEHIPHHKRASAAVPAVICKCLMVYGLERTQQFCEALTNMKFTGPDDPSHMLWLYLMKNSARDEQTVQVYRKTLCAVRAYMEKKKIEKLYPVKTDIFEWDEDYTLPDGLTATSDQVDLGILKQRLTKKEGDVAKKAEEQEKVKKEVDEAFEAMEQERIQDLIKRGVILPD